MNCFFKLIKYSAYAFLYLAVTIIVAYIVFAEGITDDGQCHAMERPLLIHYILAFIITGLPMLALIYCKNKKLKKDK
ncbi:MULTISPECIES: Holliday junction ATP-dependent DNA helicase RuvA [unclassified Rickettsia]|uniref:Holliday junction ATP-dependent DNA helicase RuvA n=1 Tax=unclassified Rickettsia TaxID=114295 RepID=UPI00209E6C1D|nr:Holliday junction ATP-dependent DNA helicase RuvA [Rickettsia endosymbiont of Ceutorhynchus assimilis]